VLVFDKGYLDYAWLAELHLAGVVFVTRVRANTQYHVTATRRVPTRGGILTDEEIALDGPRSQKKYPADLPLPRVSVQVDDREAPLVFLTNQVAWGPTTIARIYKDRWQIELFFKALKQNLRVKTFVGTSRNALPIQFWTALIALLLLKYLQLKATFGWSLSNLLALLRMNLFAYRDVWTFLNDPFSAPPPLPEPAQAELALG
jgi:IS4 transposase